MWARLPIGSFPEVLLKREPRNSPFLSGNSSRSNQVVRPAETVACVGLGNQHDAIATPVQVIPTDHCVYRVAVGTRQQFSDCCSVPEQDLELATPPSGVVRGGRKGGLHL